MKQVYFHYSFWEDWKAGLYSCVDKSMEPQLINNSREILSNIELFRSIMLKILKEWKYSSQMQLSNNSRNRQAWLGQAACCYSHKVPEYLTKAAWRQLTEQQQIEANNTADEIIYRFDNGIHWSQRCLSDY